jgi:hypothetical protein
MEKDDRKDRYDDTLRKQEAKKRELQEKKGKINKISSNNKDNRESNLKEKKIKKGNGFREHLGLILIAVGILLTLSIYLFFIGIPLIIIGAYYLNKKVNRKLKEIDFELVEKEKDLDKKLEGKKDELANIDSKLDKLEKKKEKEINIKLEEKQGELNNIDHILEEKEKEFDIKLKDKREELDNIDIKLEEMEKAKEREIDIKLNEKNAQLANMDSELKKKREKFGLIEDEAEMQEIGLYEPRYDFLTAVLYKEKLDEIRKKQKEIIKNKTAAVCDTEWTVEDSKQKGKAMTNANIKQILLNFNLECEMTISKVKVSTIDSSIKKINKAFERLNRLNERNVIRITPQYLNLKLQELDVAIEYELKKQEEKEILRQEREMQREERKKQKQLDMQEKKIKKQKQDVETELNKIKEEIKSKSDEEKGKLEEKIKELELALAKSNTENEHIDEDRKRTGAGYVYILSNIGSFGENIYKIGVTRRDDPVGRVTELSDASVPFRFDNHVFIFSEEAFTLEKELHNRFDEKRVNKVNMRKEFFYITIDDVKKIVEENKDIVHSFNEKAEAQEYRDTLKIEKGIK